MTISAVDPETPLGSCDQGGLTKGTFEGNPTRSEMSAHGIEILVLCTI